MNEHPRNAQAIKPIYVLMKAISELEQFRADKDDFFAHDHRAPLTSDQQRKFKGLAYFPTNPALIVKARIDRHVEPGVVRMETTKGQEQVYRRYGVVSFQVDGEATQVTLYESDGGHGLFLPFRDATSGKETYGAGRYLDLDHRGEEIVIDFNYAYNPYCAYNADWSCPLPPGENWLKVSIRAGERNFPAEA
jgi:uncharacterized protein (DUF1684 family)